MSDSLPIEAGVLRLLPEHLDYLGFAALRHKLDTEDDVFGFLERVKKSELEELAKLADRVLMRNDYPEVISFLNEYPLDKFRECAWLYFLFGLLDYADMKFDHPVNGRD